MKYMLLFYANEAAPIPEAEQAALYTNWMDLLKEAKAAGVLLDHNGLAPITTATTVRVRDNKTLTTDGPFAETHEQMGGFFLLNCQDLDEAVAWAAKVPTAKYGSIEIRPTWDNA
jgi:hypothetical protein